MPFIGQWQQRFSQHHILIDVDREFAFFSALDGAFCANNVAHIGELLEVVEGLRVCLTHVFLNARFVEIKLNRARLVLQREECQLAKDAPRHNSACDRHFNFDFFATG